MAGPLGLITHDYLETSWERARGYLKEELSQLRTALTRQWGQIFDREGNIYISHVPAIPLDDPDHVEGDLPFENLPDVTESHLLGRGEGAGDGEIQEIEIGANLTMTGNVLSADAQAPTTRWEPLTNGDILIPELVFADGDVVMVEVPL